MTNIFGLRLKPSGNDFAAQLLSENQIAIGWSQAKALLDPSLSKADFKRLLGEIYPSIAEKKRTGHASGQLWRFIREARTDDIVVVPHDQDIYFVKITGDTTYNADALADDTSIRRSVTKLISNPVPRGSLPFSLQKALRFRHPTADLSAVKQEVLDVIGAKDTTITFAALESGQDIHAAVLKWQRAFALLGSTSHGFSEDMLWIEDLGIWLQMKGWDEESRHRFWNGLGNKPGSRETRNLIVEVNPPDGPTPGRWQGLVAEGSDGSTWILHRGEMNVQANRVFLDGNISDGQLNRVSVSFPDGSSDLYYQVACVDLEPLEIVLQSKRFMDVCLQVRTSITDESDESVEVQRKAHEFEESIGFSYVPPQEGKQVWRTHAEVSRDLKLALKDIGLNPSLERVGDLGPDMYTVGDSPLLFEIKTNTGAGDYLKAVGQLFVYEKVLEKPHRKFLVIPDGIDAKAADIIHELGISIIEFRKEGIGYTFDLPDDL